MFKLMVKYLKPLDWFFIVLCAGFVVAQVYFDITMPEYTAKLTIEVQAGMATMKSIWKNGGFMLLYAFASMVSSIICGYFASRTAANFAKTLRKALFERVTSFSAAEINKFGTPSLITRTTNDVVQMQNFIAMGLQMLIKAPVLAVWSICKISGAAVQWTVATVIIVAVIVVIVGVLVGICYPKFKQMQKLTDGLNTTTRENITGVRVIRAFNAEDYQTQKFEAVNENVKRNQLFTSRGLGLMMPVIQTCMNGLTLAVYWIGAVLINKAAAIPARLELLGNMTVFTQYAMQVVMAFMMLIMIFMILPRCMVSGKRIADVLGTRRSVRSGAVKAIERDNGVPVLQFRNVDFAYDHGEGKVVSGIDFTVNRGETVAFIGATGSGKTTIINLIERFYDVDNGEVLFNGVNVKEYDEEVLRGSIALASQRAVLFKGDIRGNVAYGDEDPDDDRLRAALEISCAAEFVDGLEKGVDSPVAQDGTNFSGGQKQRLSIARAVYKGGDLLIFDDSFSALDYKTDMLVRKNIRERLDELSVGYASDEYDSGAVYDNIKQRPRKSAVLIVAQRIGTIMNADKIIVLDEGKIVGMGKHKELLATCPTYKEIALSQLSKEEL
ncbi:MAG: ABC transporter ATP-binding protein/permease [Clostridiales bacterium]|nr:ABC transporter ATP-binding protein/permease [Clostridiales bacterium]